MSQTNGAGRGCPCPIGKNKNQFCGKTETFGIIHEFRKLYEGELHEIEARGHGLQAKAELQQNWIRDLTEQNEMLVHVVEELEVEATDRVAMLEEKLFNSAQHGNEVMQKYKDFNFAINLDETFQNLVYLQSDVRNLLELIKRARNEGTWNIDGLNFYNIGCEDLFGSPIPDQGITGDERTEKQLKMTQKLQEKERMLKHSQEILDRCPMDAEALSIRLKEKDQELNTLRRSMLDMRNALTIEVAEKHDVILNLRRDVQQLEEKCRQANKQTQFKDDIIKELRKEAKQLKSQISVEASMNGEDLRMRIEKLEQENKILRQQISEAERQRRSKAIIQAFEKETVTNRHQDAAEILAALEKEHQDREVEQSRHNEEIRNLNETILELEQDLQNSLVHAENLHKTDKDVERSKHNEEIKNLNERILELENALEISHIRAEQLQKTVDLYQNSVNILEVSEQQSIIEISQLRQTVLNLQEALVTSKHQLDELQQKASTEIYRYIHSINDLRNILFSTEKQHMLTYKELDCLKDVVEHLQDTNLDLAVANFSYIQDVAILESRLLKYQHICKSTEGSLDVEITKLREDCKQQLMANSYLKKQLEAVTFACKSMRNMEIEAQELHKMLQKVNGKLLLQADATKEELLRETELNVIKTKKIEELQKMVESKTIELNQYECCKIGQELNMTIEQNKELQTELSQLKGQIETYRETAATSEELSQHCQKEIEKCKCNIIELSNRYLQTKEQLQEKTEICSELDAKLCVQNSNCSCLEQQLYDNKIRYELDKADLRNTINDLNNKLVKSENNYHILHENFRQSQEEILEITQRKAKLEMDHDEYTVTMHKLKQQELGLGECVCQLETESEVLKTDLVDKSLQITILQEENIKLKNELNKSLQQFNKLKADHEQLHKSFEELNSGLSKTEYSSHIKKEQFNQCLCGLQAVHTEKNRLEAKNEQLQLELTKLQHAYADMDQKYKKLKDSFITLEVKLLDNNMCREEICAESRNVISNVRAWLQNQTTINEELTQKLRDDEVLIENLKLQIVRLNTQSKCQICGCKGRERGGGNGDQFLRLAAATRSQPNLWSFGSQESGTVSPASIVSNTQEWYSYEEFSEERYTDDDTLLNHCLKRVESINEDLQKSNRFWQTKLMGHDYLVTRDQ